MDRNDCRLVGKIGSVLKEGKTQNGQTYIWFALNIEARSNANSTENNYRQSIHVMCFKKNVVDYLKRVKAHQGNTAIVFGFISSFPDEIKGKAVTVNAINANDIYIAKTKPDKKDED